MKMDLQHPFVHVFRGGGNLLQTPDLEINVTVNI